jgi:hypothetical protein
MPNYASKTPKGADYNRDHDPDDDYLCPACGAHYLPDALALVCNVCGEQEEYSSEAPF